MIDARRCKAQSKRSGARCKRYASTGREVCRMHGGATPRGIDSPHIKSGRYSKELPADLLTTFNESLADVELKELERELALVDARTSQLLQDLNSGKAVPAWEDAVYAWRAYKRAKLKRDKAAADDAAARLDDVLETQSSRERCWGEVKELVALRRKLTDSQTKRDVMTGRFVEATKVAVLVTALVDAVNSEADSATARIIGLRFKALLTPLPPLEQ